jgi:hypothetical protein
MVGIVAAKLAVVAVVVVLPSGLALSIGAVHAAGMLVVLAAAVVALLVVRRRGGRWRVVLAHLPLGRLHRPTRHGRQR